MRAALFSRRKPARTTRRLELETLEARELLNADLGPLTDPATVYGTQQVTGVLAPDMAIDGNGERFVLAWTDQVGPNQYHVRARVMDATGAFLTDVITVTADPLPALLNRSPRIDVAMDEQGRFAVAYDGKPFAAGLADIGIQRYDATGTPYGSVYTIGTSNRLDINPNIDLADDGRILVAYDQATSTLTTNRLNFTLFASFENLNSNIQVSTSSTGEKSTRTQCSTPTVPLWSAARR